MCPSFVHLIACPFSAKPEVEAKSLPVRGKELMMEINKDEALNIHNYFQIFTRTVLSSVRDTSEKIIVYVYVKLKTYPLFFMFYTQECAREAGGGARRNNVFIVIVIQQLKNLESDHFLHVE